MTEHVSQVLAGVLPAGEEQRDPLPPSQRHDARREDTLAFRFLVSVGFGLRLPGDTQDPHRRVVVVQHLALGRLPDQLLVDRLEHMGGLADDVPLGRGWQRNAQTPLQPLQSIEG